MLLGDYIELLENLHRDDISNLELKNENINDKMAGMLAKSLALNKIKKTIDLSNNQITNQGALEIIACLQTNTSIESISLEGNKIDKPLLDQIDLLLQKNKKYRIEEDGSFLQLGAYNNNPAEITTLYSSVTPVTFHKEFVLDMSYSHEIDKALTSAVALTDSALHYLQNPAINRTFIFQLNLPDIDGENLNQFQIKMLSSIIATLGKIGILASGMMDFKEFDFNLELPILSFPLNKLLYPEFTVENLENLGKVVNVLQGNQLEKFSLCLNLSKIPLTDSLLQEERCFLDISRHISAFVDFQKPVNLTHFSLNLSFPFFDLTTDASDDRILKNSKILANLGGLGKLSKYLSNEKVTHFSLILTIPDLNIQSDSSEMAFYRDNGFSEVLKNIEIFSKIGDLGSAETASFYYHLNHFCIHLKIPDINLSFPRLENSETIEESYSKMLNGMGNLGKLGNLASPLYEINLKHFSLILKIPEIKIPYSYFKEPASKILEAYERMQQRVGHLRNFFNINDNFLPIHFSLDLDLPDVLIFSHPNERESSSLLTTYCILFSCAMNTFKPSRYYDNSLKHFSVHLKLPNINILFAPSENQKNIMLQTYLLGVIEIVHHQTIFESFRKSFHQLTHFSIDLKMPNIYNPFTDISYLSEGSTIDYYLEFISSLATFLKEIRTEIIYFYSKMKTLKEKVKTQYFFLNLSLPVVQTIFLAPEIIEATIKKLMISVRDANEIQKEADFKESLAHFFSLKIDPLVIDFSEHKNFDFREALSSGFFSRLFETNLSSYLNCVLVSKNQASKIKKFYSIVPFNIKIALSNISNNQNSNTPVNIKADPLNESSNLKGDEASYLPSSISLADESRSKFSEFGEASRLINHKKSILMSEDMCLVLFYKVVKNNSYYALKTLIDAGKADQQDPSFKSTLLHYSVENLTLLAKKTFLDSHPKKMRVAEYAKIETIIQLLLDSNANINIKSSKNETPLSLLVRSCPILYTDPSESASSVSEKLNLLEKCKEKIIFLSELFCKKLKNHEDPEILEKYVSEIKFKLSGNYSRQFFPSSGNYFFAQTHEVSLSAKKILNKR